MPLCSRACSHDFQYLNPHNFGGILVPRLIHITEIRVLTISEILKGMGQTCVSSLINTGSSKLITLLVLLNEVPTETK